MYNVGARIGNEVFVWKVPPIIDQTEQHKTNQSKRNDTTIRDQSNRKRNSREVFKNNWSIASYSKKFGKNYIITLVFKMISRF